jgi:diaminopimelate decarboxylase
LVPEVLVRESEWALVRPRLEVSDLIALDRLSPWLLTPRERCEP